MLSWAYLFTIDPSFSSSFSVVDALPCSSDTILWYAKSTASSHGNLTLTRIWNAIALALSKNKNSDTEILFALIWQSHSNISFTTLECSAPLILSPISLLLDVFHLVLTSKEYAEDKKTPHSFINLDLLSCSLTFSSGDIVTSLYLLFNTMTEFSAWSIGLASWRWTQQLMERIHTLTQQQITNGCLCEASSSAFDISIWAHFQLFRIWIPEGFFSI